MFHLVKYKKHDIDIMTHEFFDRLVPKDMDVMLRCSICGNYKTIQVTNYSIGTHSGSQQAELNFVMQCGKCGAEVNVRYKGFIQSVLVQLIKKIEHREYSDAEG